MAPTTPDHERFNCPRCAQPGVCVRVTLHHGEKDVDLRCAACDHEWTVTEPDHGSLFHRKTA